MQYIEVEVFAHRMDDKLTKKDDINDLMESSSKGTQVMNWLSKL